MLDKKLLTIVFSISILAVSAGVTLATPLELDYGDAPDPTYPTLLANNGASHGATGPMLGNTRDHEPDGQPTINADGDDTGLTDDEDGVVFTSPLVPTEQATVDVTASSGGVLNAWVDFNLDGDWFDAGEQIFTDQVLVAGVNSLAFSLPAGAVANTVFYSRFRLDSGGGLNPNGQAADGEVEDHLVMEGDSNENGGGGGGCNTVGLRPGESLWPDILAIALLAGMLLVLRKRARDEKARFLCKR
jgi:hypothetical protein